jgi:uncharacterized protein (DUF58 family)
MIPREILQRVRQIEIKTRSVVDAILSGEYHSAFKGRGMEFSEVREYTEGDDIRSIDWNVTARTGHPHVKKHIEERELTVMLVVDASASGDFGTAGQYKSERAVEMCALLAFSAIKNSDRVGLIIFTNEVETYIPPKKGRNHVLRVIRELLYFRPRNSSTRISEAIDFLNRVQKRKTVVFLVSDFLDSDYHSALRIAAHRHDIIACTVSDPREYTLPPVGLATVFDPETGEQMVIDTSSRSFVRQFTTAMQHQAQQRSSFFRMHSIDEIPISTDTDYVEALIRFFKKRERTLV